MAPESRKDESPEDGMSLEDALCPVCLEIYLEPVTLPCTHTFCKGCFLESVDKATLCCPLCRKRVSTWARIHSRNRTLVNQNLWDRIQTRFPLQCQRRLSGQENDEDARRPACVPRVSLPGELRREYEDQVTKLQQEQQHMLQDQQKASEELIQKLLQEEDQLLEDERKRREEDEQLAQRLSDELNPPPPPPPPCPETLRLVEVKKKKEVTIGQMDRFLIPRAPRAPSLPRLDYYGPQLEVEVSLGAVEVHLGNHLVPQVGEEVHLGNHLVPQVGEEVCLGEQEGEELHPGVQLGSHLISTKRKTWESPEEEQGGASKRLLMPRSSVEQEEAELQERLQQQEHLQLQDQEQLQQQKQQKQQQKQLQRQQQEQADLQEELQQVQLQRQDQEQADLRLAQLLQKQLNREERQKATDRRKGSSDAYLLRHKQGSSRPHAARTSRRSSSSSLSSSSSSSSPSSSSSSSSSPSSSSSSSSSPSSRRGRKQLTLTDMFSSLS